MKIILKWDHFLQKGDLMKIEHDSFFVDFVVRVLLMLFSCNIVPFVWLKCVAPFFSWSLWTMVDFFRSNYFYPSYRLVCSRHRLVKSHQLFLTIFLFEFDTIPADEPKRAPESSLFCEFHFLYVILDSKNLFTKTWLSGEAHTTVVTP